MLLGIDFGTTRTVVSAALQGRYPIVTFDVDGTFVDYLPGVAAVRDGELFFGWDAVREMHGPAGVHGAIRSIKRVVGAMASDDKVAGLPGMDLSALELATGFLAYTRRALLEYSNLDIADSDEPLETAVAVPANASTRQRYLTLEAFTAAGFLVRGLINEPTAAAIEFAFRRLANLGPRSPKRYVVVYDLGGGTFDTSAVSLVDRRFELLDSEGAARLGGDDFDRTLLDMVCQALGVPGLPDALDVKTHTLALERCREFKESLTPKSRKILVDLSDDVPELMPVVIEANAFYDRCQALIQRTLTIIGTLFARLPEHGIDPENPRELGGLYLVGGGVAFPPVARVLREHYKRKIQLAPHPHAATALGLAMYADPDAGIFVREATTRYFGVWREADSGERKIFDCILSKNLVPEGDQPVIVQRTYRPTHTIGTLRFLECSSLDNDGQPTGDVTPWTRILFPYAPALAGQKDLRGFVVERDSNLVGGQIVESYQYASDGTMTVEITNRTHGYSRRYTLGAFG